MMMATVMQLGLRQSHVGFIHKEQKRFLIFSDGLSDPYLANDVDDDHNFAQDTGYIIIIIITMIIVVVIIVIIVAVILVSRKFSHLSSKHWVDY